VRSKSIIMTGPPRRPLAQVMPDKRAGAPHRTFASHIVLHNEALSVDNPASPGSRTKLSAQPHQKAVRIGVGRTWASEEDVEVEAEVNASFQE
jgi:hypothetical protein